MSCPDAVSLRDYVDARCRAIEETIVLQSEVAQRAINVAARDLDKRLDAMNEFREQLSQQAAHFIDRPQHEALEHRIHLLEQAKANMEGRIYATGAILTIGVVALQLLLHYFGAR